MVLEMTTSKGILFRAKEWHARRLDFSEGDALQALLERCEDYFHLVCGTPPGSSAAQALFTQVPEGKDTGDKILIGIFGSTGSLVGVLDVIRDYPAPAEWFLGLLLLEPRQRNFGLGGQSYRAFERWATGSGAQHIRLGVVEQNEGAYRFWRRMGFEQMRKGRRRRLVRWKGLQL